MLTRRQVFRAGVAAACAASCTSKADEALTQVERTYFVPNFASGDRLAQESAAGFRSLVSAGSLARENFLPGPPGAGHVVILAGVRSFPGRFVRELRNHVEAGAWVIWERAAIFDGGTQSVCEQLLAHFFDIRTSSPNRPDSTYIRYCWPQARSVRWFHDAVRVECLPHEVIAECKGQPIAMKRRIGKGGIVFLGTMLGPGIRAEEREAQEIGRALIA